MLIAIMCDYRRVPTNVPSIVNIPSIFHEYSINIPSIFHDITISVVSQQPAVQDPFGARGDRASQTGGTAAWQQQALAW
jgi:hypothetical protein